MYPDRVDPSLSAGKVVDGGHMVRDILLMKRANFNAVRASHYPNTYAW
jgi:beta-galactosidase